MENFAVIDFETMGMSPSEKVRAVSVSLAVVKDGQVVERFHSLMNSGVPMPEDAEMLTGITSGMLANSPVSSVVMQQVVSLTKGCRLAAHNADFHQAFWLFELAASGIHQDDAPFICTLKLARQTYPGLDIYALNNLAAALGLPSEEGPESMPTNADLATNLLLHIQHEFEPRSRNS